jgi:hypothetical protein
MPREARTGISTSSFDRRFMQQSHGFYQQIDIRRIARHEDVSFQTLNRQHPTKPAKEIAVLPFRQTLMKRLSVCKPSCIASSLIQWLG